MELNPDGSISKLNEILADVLKCNTKDVYQELESLLNYMIKKKALHEYGVTKQDLKEFTDVVMTKQGRLMANNYAELNSEKVMKIYEKLF